MAPTKAGRYTVAVLATVAALALSACSGSSGSSGSTKSSGSSGSSGSKSSKASTHITVSHGFTDAEAKALNAAVKQWNQENPSETVSLSFTSNDTALQKTVANFTAGNYPDVAYEYGSSAARLARQPKLVDLTSKVTAASMDWNDFYPSERAAATVKGKVVGVPSLVDNLSLVYNKKVFQKAGVALPNASWTWQDFRTAAKKLTNSSTHNYGWAYVNDGSEDTVWRYLAMLWQAGGDLLNQDNTKPVFDSPAGLAALEQLRNMTVVDKSVYLDTGNQNYINLFNSGKVAMLWTGPWDLSTINPDVDYGVTVLPGYNGNHETISGPDLYLLFDHSAARSDTAFKFVSWLTSAKVHIQFAIATGDLPLRVSETKLPQYQTFLKKYPAEKVFVANLNNVKHVRPNIATYPQVSQALGQMLQSVLLGQSSSKKALDTASAAAVSALAGN